MEQFDHENRYLSMKREVDGFYWFKLRSTVLDMIIDTFIRSMIKYTRATSLIDSPVRLTILGVHM
jgi:hypothetical protein